MSPWLLGIIGTAVVAFIVFVVVRVVVAHRQQSVVGREGLVGKVAIAETALQPTGVVLVEGELWAAISDNGLVEPEEEVLITKVEGLKLRVIKKLEEGGQR